MSVGTTLMDNAKSVLLQSLTGSSPLPNLEGHKDTHWTFYLLGAGALSSLVVAIAGIILNQLGILFAGLCYAIIMGIGTWYVKRFGSEEVFENYIAIFTDRVKSYVKETEELQKANNDLNQELKKSQQIISEKQQELEKTSQDLTKNIQELEKKQKFAEEFIASIDKFKKENITLDSILDKISNQSKQQNDYKEKLEKQAAALQVENQNLQAQLNTFVANNKSYASENKDLKQLVDQLKSQIKNTVTPNIGTANQTAKEFDTVLNNIEKNENDLNSKLDKASDAIQNLLNQ